MRRRAVRAAGRLAFAYVSWLSHIPVAFTCDSCDDDNDDDSDSDNDGDGSGLSREAVIGIVVACVVLIVFLVVFGTQWLRRRFLRARRTRFDTPHDHDETETKHHRPSNPFKQFGASIRNGYRTVAMSASPTEQHTPQYSVHGRGSRHHDRDSQSHHPPHRDALMRPEFVDPVSLPSLHIPSRPSPTSRPVSVSPVAAVSLLQQPARQDEPVPAVPRSPVSAPPLSSSPDPPPRSIALEPPLLPPPSLPPQSHWVVMAPVASGSSSMPPPPPMRAPAYTGPSKRAVSGAPPPYTPI